MAGALSFLDLRLGQGFDGVLAMPLGHHLLVQQADLVAAGRGEEEGEQAMQETGDRPPQHAQAKGRGRHQVLPVGLAHGCGMIGKSLHGMPS